MEQELDERKRTILTAIIQTYLETGEPVGSRTISKYTNLNLSSATIRNEMSDLEEMGYIIQPHTSAGRIPSDKGYRLYVNELIEKKNQEIDDVKDVMIQKTDKLEKMLKQVVQVLARNTNYATMIAGPSYHQNRLKFIQLSRINEKQLLAVIVADGDLMKNQMINLDEPIDDENLMGMNLMLNTQLSGKTIGEIDLNLITRLKQDAGEHSNVVGRILDAVGEAIQPDEEDLPIFTSGATNIFDYPELADSRNAKELLTAFEDKRGLAEMIRGSSDGIDEETGIAAYIGTESPLRNMKDCSVVTANYDLGNGMKGTVAIVGPRRMDYKRVVENLKQLKFEMNNLFGSGEGRVKALEDNSRTEDDMD
ncbi:MAG: heat-inducible transcriptional repressor HrcA [Eubacteriales bacterium]|nr:heat-inducible transcriptional repressor HrcA [Eubacteriales bacterium]